VGDSVVPEMIAVPSGWWALLSPGGSSANALTANGLSEMGEAAIFTIPLCKWNWPGQSGNDAEPRLAADRRKRTCGSPAPLAQGGGYRRTFGLAGQAIARVDRFRSRPPWSLLDGSSSIQQTGS
jgi:hypothetical protein